ncbi:histidine kinase [Caldibacillus lycopersici]|uniref:Histidine kinase n=1 Tax=Perspicuibacillus lycopersici TaxID=1325689 RepID=A0AAE3LSC2_9BACI|nr:histidine kinase [Perspicuibacillus lycopersici]MCU9612583.1 histidine kinase [Perspicuibacillus lycopersici]
MKIPDKNSSHSINYYSKVLVVVIITVLLINVFVSILTISITRQQSIENITNTINLYLKQVQQKFNSVEHFMIWTVLNEPLIDDINDAKDYYEFADSIDNFRSRVIDYQYSTGEEYQFFLLLKKENYFFNSSPINVNYSEYLKIKDYFLSEIEKFQSYENMKTWKTFELNNNYYLYHLIDYEDRVFISLISVNDILLPLKDINLGNKGAIIMENDAGTYLTNATEELSLQNNTQKPLAISYLRFKEKEIDLPFSLHVYVDNVSAFKRIMIAQLSLTFATVVISIILIMILIYIKNKLLYPIQAFSNNLSKINDSNEAIDFNNSNIKELEQANVQFKDLIKEIRKLKINIYEQELEKQNIQMDFMKLQIKPHFYINCLTTIYSMAQLEMYKEIQEMTLSTSKYFRYLFQTKQNFVKLEKELDHINDYLAIQKLLHGPTFTFERYVENGVENAKIPPLVLQTFIENSIKHIRSYDKQIKITLRIQSVENEGLLKMVITDNGQGFPKDILEKLQNNKSLSSVDGSHIGINNVISRLQLLYSEKFKIDFSNAKTGGAVVMLLIPNDVFEGVEV